MNHFSPRIAVVVPVYNSAAFLADTLRSVLAQTLHADEIIVVDDGSLDDSAEIAMRVSSLVKVVRQANTGQGGARQRGFENSTADLLLFLDADDLLHPLALEKLMAALARHPSAPLAFGFADLWNPEQKEILRHDKLNCPEQGRCWEGLLAGNYIRTPGCALVRRAALTAAGGWDVDVLLKGHEDWELWLRLAEQDEFVMIPESLIKYRQHPGGFSHNRVEMYGSLFVMFAKQRARWKADPNRMRLLNDAEWFKRLSVAKELFHSARAALGAGKYQLAICQIGEALRFGGWPFVIRVLQWPLRKINRLF